MTDPLLLDAKALARLSSTSPATIWRWDSAGKIPRPLRLSKGTTRWRRSDIELWVELGCPHRKEFESMKVSAAGK